MTNIQAFLLKQALKEKQKIENASMVIYFILFLLFSTNLVLRSFGVIDGGTCSIINTSLLIVQVIWGCIIEKAIREKISRKLISIIIERKY